jgi:hypothetical protein
MAGHPGFAGVAVVVLAGLGGVAEGAGLRSAEGAEVPSAAIIVELSDLAGIPTETLTQARRQVSLIYRDIGVEVLWTDAPVNDAHDRFIVHLLIRTKPPRPRMMGNALGDSRGTAGTAFVYRDRVLDVARGRRMDFATVLAYGMAHEIGHLLLPAPSHAISGIMNADWNGHDFRDMAAGALHFTPGQASAIRSRAGASASAAPASSDPAASSQPSAVSNQPPAVTNQPPAMN